MATVKVVDKVYGKKLLRALFDFSRVNHLTDTLLKFKKTEIFVHRLVLSAASEVFAAMFQSDMRERVEGKVDLSTFNIDENVANEFVEYMYTGLIYLTEKNVEGLLTCANYFMMADLQNICCGYLEESLSPKNCLGTFDIASRLQCFELRETCLKMTHEKFCEIVEETQFLELTYISVLDMLSEDRIEVESEDVVFFAFIRWVQHDLKFRSNYFQGVFQCVRIKFLSDHCYKILKLKVCDGFFKNAAIARQLIIDGNIINNNDNNSNTIINNDDVDGNDELRVNIKNVPRQCLNTSAVIMTTGGYDGNSCLISSFALSLADSTWVHLAPMRISRHDHGTVSLGNNLFVAGGFNSRKGPLNSAEQYNSIRNQWEEVSSMNSKRKSLGICVFQDKLFVSGGLDENYNALDTVEFYDGSQNTWQLFISMNQPRYNHGFVGSNEHGLFTIGGWKNGTAERFSNGEWNMIAPMSLPRAGATSVIEGSKIYVFGGYSDAQCISTIEIYDIFQDNWTNGASASISRWRAGCAIVDSLIYIIGGRDSSWQYLDTVEAYDIESDEWKLETPLPCKIMGLRCSVVNVPKHTIDFRSLR